MTRLYETVPAAPSAPTASRPAVGRSVAMPSGIAYDPDGASAVGRGLGRAAALVDDLPFVPQNPYEPRRRQIAWRAALIVLLALAAYLPTLGGGWLWHDEHVFADPALRSAAGLADIWARPFAKGDAPAARSLAWAVVHTLGPGPAGFRAVSLALHGLTAVMVWLALRRLAVGGAWLAAAVLAVHPGGLVTVAWVSRQHEVLAAAAAATGLWAYLRARGIGPEPDESVWTDPDFAAADDRPRRGAWAVCAVAMTTAVLSGSVAAAAALLALLAIERRRRLTTVPTAPATAADSAIAASAADSSSPFAGLSARVAVLLIVGAVAAVGVRWGLARGTPMALAESAAALAWTAGHAVMPLDVPFLYDRGQWPLAWTLPLAAVAVAVGGVALAVAFRRSAWAATLAIAGVAAALHGLTLGQADADAVLAADLLPYGVLTLAIVGAAALLSLLIAKLRCAHRRRAARWLTGTAWIVGLVTISYFRAPAYAEADALWQHTLALNPSGVVAREELAASYVSEGFVEEAAQQLDRVPEPARDARWQLARGRAYDALERYAEAATCYETAHRDRPADQAITISLAAAHTRAGRPDQAAALYADLVARHPADPALLTAAGTAQLRLGRLQAAADLYERALAHDPAYLPAHLSLATALFDLGRPEPAAAHLQTVIGLDPRNFEAFMRAGVLLHRLGDPAKAEKMFRAAVNLDGTSADAFDNLGIVLAARNKTQEALWSFTQATRLDPAHAANYHLQAYRRQLAAQAASQPNQ